MNKHLLQSNEWKEFQEEIGRVSFEVGGNFFYRYDLPMNLSYIYGPRIQNSEFRIQKLKEIAMQEKSVFVRIDTERDLKEKFYNLGFIKAKKEIQPKDTLILDISSSEEEILKQMHHKTRYNIRLSKRKGVKVRISSDEKDVNEFYRLMEKTTERDKFSSHPKEYYQKQVDILSGKDLVRMFLAEFEDKVIAAIFVSFYGGRATYLHGASDNEYRKLMAPHLLQWEAIKEAKRRGCNEYDFWGIAPSDAGSDHPWAGITRFKRGFGGVEKNYIGAWDYVFKPFWYKIYNLISK